MNGRETQRLAADTPVLVLRPAIAPVTGWLFVGGVATFLAVATLAVVGPTWWRWALAVVAATLTLVQLLQLVFRQLFTVRFDGAGIHAKGLTHWVDQPWDKVDTATIEHVLADLGLRLVVFDRRNPAPATDRRAARQTHWVHLPLGTDPDQVGQVVEHYLGASAHKESA